MSDNSSGIRYKLLGASGAVTVLGVLSLIVNFFEMEINSPFFVHNFDRELGIAISTGMIVIGGAIGFLAHKKRP